MYAQAEGEKSSRPTRDERRRRYAGVPGPARDDPRATETGFGIHVGNLPHARAVPAPGWPSKVHGKNNRLRAVRRRDERRRRRLAGNGVFARVQPRLVVCRPRRVNRRRDAAHERVDGVLVRGERVWSVERARAPRTSARRIPPSS